MVFPDLKKEENRSVANIFKERILDQTGNSEVAQGPVYKDQSFQILKSSNYVICVVCRLSTFLTRYTDTNFGLLNHRHVVCTVSNGQHTLL